jgi:HAD superfamily hydrolase (TIGR01549 family)
MIKTYLFDLDDTLIDISIYRIAFPKIIQRIKAIMKLSDGDIDKIAEENNIKKSEWGYDTGELCKVLGLLDIYYEILEEEIRKNSKLKFDVNAKFKELKEKEKQIGICSNSMKKTIKMQLDANNVKGYDFIFSSEDAGVKKNNKKYWQELIKKYNLKPEECVVIGDDEIDDKKIPKSLVFNNK